MAKLENSGVLLTGLGLGVGLMYFLDPDRGRRRRSLVRDRVVHTARVGSSAVGSTSRDLKNRAAGAVSRARDTFKREKVDDAVLVERVRSELGRLVWNPHSIQVESEHGVVTLRGTIRENQIPRVLAAVEDISGVREVINALEPKEEPQSDESAQQEKTFARRQRRWSPAARFAAGTAGSALAGYGATRHDIPKVLLMASGLGLLARAAFNVDMRRLTGVGAGRRAVDVQKTITIDAPIDTVYAFWTEYENFPRFMSRVLEVRPTSSDHHSHWKVFGPAGMPVEFDAEVIAMIPNRVFAWRTLKGSPVAHAGQVRFEPEGDHRTRLQIRMSYNPPGGWLGHGVASAFGVDPKSSLDEDLQRMKMLLETGRVAHDVAKPQG